LADRGGIEVVEVGGAVSAVQWDCVAGVTAGGGRRTLAIVLFSLGFGLLRSEYVP
jgi:hypothetical protein